MNATAELKIEDLASTDPKVKYACAKSVLAIAAARPKELYPYLCLFQSMLEGDNRILRWTAIDVVGAMGRVAAVKDVHGLIERLLPMLDTGNMITANHAIAALADIARARPEHRAHITAELIKVESYRYDTDECRNIAVGKALLALGSYQLPEAAMNAAVDFARRQVGNRRPATAKKAAVFLRWHA